MNSMTGLLVAVVTQPSKAQQAQPLSIPILSICPVILLIPLTLQLAATTISLFAAVHTIDDPDGDTDLVISWSHSYSQVQTLTSKGQVDL